MVHSDFSGGENLAANTIHNVSYMFNQWMAEKEAFDESGYRAKLMGVSYNGKVVGHYSQIVWATNTKVGCGLTYCEDYTYKNILVCRYQTGNILYQQVYGEPISSSSSSSSSLSTTATTTTTTTSAATSTVTLTIIKSIITISTTTKTVTEPTTVHESTTITTTITEPTTVHESTMVTTTITEPTTITSAIYETTLINCNVTERTTEINSTISTVDPATLNSSSDDDKSGVNDILSNKRFNLIFIILFFCIYFKLNIL